MRLLWINWPWTLETLWDSPAFRRPLADWMPAIWRHQLAWFNDSDEGWGEVAHWMPSRRHQQMRSLVADPANADPATMRQALAAAGWARPLYPGCCCEYGSRLGRYEYDPDEDRVRFWIREPFASDAKDVRLVDWPVFVGPPECLDPKRLEQGCPA